MREEIQAGSILIADGAQVPNFLRSESAAFSTRWRLVTALDGHGLRRKIREAGWSFVPLSGEIKATALGFGKQQTARRAFQRCFAKSGQRMFNCLEITQVILQRFFGLLRVIVTARPRNLEEGASRPGAARFADWRSAMLVGS